MPPAPPNDVPAHLSSASVRVLGSVGFKGESYVEVGS